MTRSNINSVWSQILIEELIRNGVTQFVISPGSRNSPLVMAVAENPRANTVVHQDERGAGFFALGYARATGTAVALIATSGSANANYFPAVLEASHSNVPLILLSCDRPVELRETGALQTMNQVNLFGAHTRWFFDLPAPNRALPPQFVLTAVGQAVYRARRQPQGPVQLNCQFREPLAPQIGSEDQTEYRRSIASWELGDRPFTRYARSAVSATEAEVDEIAKLVSASKRAIMVAGPLPPHKTHEAIMRVATHWQVPLLADVASGLRFAPEATPNLCSHYDYLLRSRAFRAGLKPDLVLHLGGIPISKALERYTQDLDAPTVLIHDSPSRQDPHHRIAHHIEMAPEDFCAALARREIGTQSSLLRSFTQAEETAQGALRAFMAEETDCTEPGVAHCILRNLYAGHGLFLGNSMPVRDADSIGIKRDVRIRVAGNRGLNGIDGGISSAIGFAAGIGSPTTVLLGDLAFLHDLNSLLLVRKSPVAMIIVVLNNDGGGIFSFLPIAQENTHFERYFATPHGLSSFEPIADQFDFAYHLPADLAEFELTYLGCLQEGRSALIEVKTDREANLTAHKKIRDFVVGRIEQSLNAS